MLLKFGAIIATLFFITVGAIAMRAGGFVGMAFDHAVRWHGRSQAKRDSPVEPQPPAAKTGVGPS